MNGTASNDAASNDAASNDAAVNDAPVRLHAVPLSSTLDVDANRRAAVAAIVDAAADGARLVVLPEYAACFDPRGVGGAQAEPLDGPFVTALRAAAREAGTVVVAGTVLPAEGEDPRGVNALVVLDGSGEVAGVYRKVHLYDAFGHRESDRLQPGSPDDPAVVVPVDGLLVGVMTCYDLRFPESARRLVDGGATVLAVPAAWAAGEHKADQWRTLLRARAIESCAYTVGAAQRGPGVTGASLVADPHGVVVAEADGERPARADLVPDVVAAARERNPSLANRRYAVVPLGRAAAQVVE